MKHPKKIKVQKVYIVIKGKKPGAYQYNENWEEQIAGFPGYIVKSFKDVNPALDWWRTNDTNKVLSENEIRKAFDKRNLLMEALMKNNDKEIKEEKPTISPVITKDTIIEICRSPLKIYTDGSLIGTDSDKAAGWAGVVLNGNKICLRIKGRKKGKKLESCSIELIAMHKVLKYLIKNEWNLNDATVYTDSQYVRLHWLKNVRPNDKNKKLWKKLWKILIQYNITINWVKGHAGDIYNEECDKLAKQAATEKLTLTQAKKIKKENKKAKSA